MNLLSCSYLSAITEFYLSTCDVSQLAGYIQEYFLKVLKFCRDFTCTR